MKRVEIAGGGLAGLSLGIALRSRGVPVTITEVSDYPRHRVCGEFVNGVTAETLERLGVNDVFHDALRHEETRWWIAGEEVLAATLTKPALGLSRWLMDERLQHSFQNLGGQLLTKTRAKREAREGLVWTAGRILKKESSWLGLKAHFRGVAVSDCLEMHLGEGGYVGVTPIHEGINVCGLFKKRRLGGGNLILAYLKKCGLHELGERLQEGEMDQTSLTGISGLALGDQGSEDDLLVLGDAERMIPPFTGNGMSMAFESADCALTPLLDWSSGEQDWAQTKKQISVALDDRFAKRIKLALILHRFLITGWGRASLTAAARAGVLPFQWLHRELSSC